MKDILKNDKIKMIIITCVTLLISIISITNGSMWGDEICRVLSPINGDFLKTIKTSLGYAQPGYMLFMFLWERITFSSSVEFVIRCSNLVFVPVAILFAYRIVKAKKWSLWTILLFFAHPMFVYYMNEATPYIIVYALSLAYTYYVFFSKDFNSKENIIKINLIYLLGVFTHFIFGFIIIIYITKCLIENYKNKENLIKHFKILCLFSILYVPLLIVYLLCLIHTITGFGIKNIAYVLYGFLGMAGIGLSRNDLRALNFNKITNIQIASLALMMISLLGLLFFILKKVRNIINNEKKYLVCILTYFLVIFAVSLVINFGVWERHCFSAFPLFMIILIDVLYYIKDNYKFSKIFIVLYIVMLLVSSFNIRFNYYYMCDDYKGIYNYLKDNKSNSTYIVNYNISIYSLKDVLGEDYYDATELSDDEIIDLFTNNKFILVLFEKDSSEKLYNYFDNNKEYKINDSFNSFKIIEHNL